MLIARDDRPGDTTRTWRPERAGRHDGTMQRTPVEIRILGCLVEKHLTTPDNYPLSTNALVAACNQRSNRDPVVDFDERTVDTAMMELRADGLARTVTGGRTNKHRHVLDEALGLDERALALLGVLMLRGPQTVGELRIRTERAATFIDIDEVESTLVALAAREQPLVRRLERRPGQKEPRWVHLLGGEPDEAAIAAAGTATDASTGSRGRFPDAESAAPARASAADVDALRAEVAELRALVTHLYGLLDEPLPAAAVADDDHADMAAGSATESPGAPTSPPS